MVKRKKKSSSSKSFEKRIDKQIRQLQEFAEGKKFREYLDTPIGRKEIKDLKKRIDDLEEELYED